MFSIINYGITVADFNFPQLLLMTVTLTDTDLILLELDRLSCRYIRQLP